MATTAIADFQDMLYEMKGPLQRTYANANPFTASLKRLTRAANRDRFSGSHVRVPMFLAQMQTGASIAENGTVPVPLPPDTDQAHIEMAHLVQPFQLNIELIKQARNADNSAAEAVGEAVRRAKEALASLFNAQLLGGGDALIAEVTSNTGSGAGLIVPVTDPNWRLLYPGKLIDILTRSNGADPGQGLRRKIVSVDRDNSTITISTTSFGGGSGNPTFANTSGVYHSGSYGAALQGLRQVAAVTGEFQGINKATVPQWRGIDGRLGDTDPVAPKRPVLDAGFLEYMLQNDDAKPEFAVGDPAVIVKYEQAHYAQFRYAVERGTLDVGIKFEGPTYEGIPLIGDFAHDWGALTFVKGDAIQLYSYEDGPDFDDMTGAMWQRFERKRAVEAWLFDDVQLGAHDCRKIMRFDNLTRAS